MNDTVRDYLCEIVIERGVSVLDNPSFVRAFLADMCADEPAERYVIVTALEERVPAQLSSYRDISASHAINRVALQMRKDTGVGENECNWAVETIALALGLISIKSLEENRGDVESMEAPNVVSHGADTATFTSQTIRTPANVLATPAQTSPSTTALPTTHATKSKSPYPDGLRTVVGLCSCWAMGITVLVILTAAGTGPASHAQLPYLHGKSLLAWWTPLVLMSTVLVVRLVRPGRTSEQWVYHVRFGSNLVMIAYGILAAWSFIHGHNISGSSTGTGGAVLLGGVLAIPFGIYFFITSAG